MATVGGFTMASRVLGFARDMLIAAVLGAGPAADAFFIAFKLPNFFRRFLGEGALSAAFVPLYASLLEKGGRERARAFAEQVLAILLWLLLLLTALFEIAMPWAMYVLAPGFADDPATFDLTVELTRLTFPYLMFISLVALLGAMLNALGRFAAYAAAPILLNVCLIVALLGAAWFETPAHALAWGVAAAGVAQFLMLVAVAHRHAVLPRLVWPRLTSEVKRLFRLIAPAAVGAGVTQVNLLVDTVIATLLPTGAVSYLYYADRVNQLPLGVVGVAVGVALLPLMARQIAAGAEESALANQNRAVEFSILLTLPAALALCVLAGPVTSVLFERGAFGPEDAAATAWALVAFAVGLPGAVLAKAFAPGYFARADTATPVRIALVCLAVNVVLNLALIWPFAHVGIALATSVSAWLNAGLLGFGLVRRGQFRADARLRHRLPRIVAAAFAMGGLLVLARIALGDWQGAGLVHRVAVLAGLVLLGLAAFGATALALGAVRRGDLATLRRRAS
jgi:putative peptidoglycan lipid II flippase